MRQYSTELWAPALGAAGTVLGYGHYGRPALVFPSEQGRAWDFANNGMVGAVADLIEAGRGQAVIARSLDAPHPAAPPPPPPGGGPPPRAGTAWGGGRPV